MKTILITGGKGQLAACLKDILGSTHNLKFIFTDVEELDITNKEAVMSYFENDSVDYCVNCAAYTAVDKAETDSDLAYAINATGAQNLAVACKKNGSILIHISTDFVFDGKQGSPYVESDKTGPLSVYGVTKLKGEELIKSSSDKYYIIRTSWLYSEHANNFMKTMLRLGNEKEELSVVSDQIGTPTYAGDLARIILKFIESTNVKFGLYHFSNIGETSWHGFAKAIFEETNTAIKLNAISSEAYPMPAERPTFSVLSSSKIASTLNIEIPYWKESLKIALHKLKKD